MLFAVNSVFNECFAKLSPRAKGIFRRCYFGTCDVTFYGTSGVIVMRAKTVCRPRQCIQPFTTHVTRFIPFVYATDFFICSDRAVQDNVERLSENNIFSNVSDNIQNDIDVM